jgi:HAD superfamily hydrolase (TIGR01509 family)
VILVKTKRVKAVIFDLDGTLVHSTVDYAKMRAKVIEILVSHGVKEELLKEAQRIWQIMHESEKQLDEMGYGAKERAEILESVTRVMNEVEMENVDKITPIEGAEDTLRRLKEMGIKIGVATRGCSAYAREALRIAGLTRFMDVVLARDEVAHSKPDPRHLLQVVEALGVTPDVAVFIGDTTTDLQTAKNAHVMFLAFSKQSLGVQRLKDAGCETVLHDLSQIIDSLELHQKACSSSLM